jgi:hypothetical protein
MIDETDLIDRIVVIMRSCWDLPSDCNEGELVAYAETLLRKIRHCEDMASLYSYLANVEVGNLDMPRSNVHYEIVDRSVALVKKAV